MVASAPENNKVFAGSSATVSDGVFSESNVTIMCGLNIYNFDELREYLYLNSRIPAGENVSFERLTGGISNRVVLVKRENSRSFVLKQPLAELRVEGKWSSDVRRIHVEAKALRWLSELVGPGAIPPFLFEDPSHHLLAMGAIPTGGKNWKSLLLDGEIQFNYFREFGTLIGTIHREAFRRSSDLAEIFADCTFFESLRLEPYYLYTARQLPEVRGFLIGLADETRRQHITVVHGDYSPKNILISTGKLILIDHEVVHFGDPAFDLGFSLTHFLSKAHKLPRSRSDLLEGARLYWMTYKRSIDESPISTEIEHRVIDHTIGCLLARVSGKSPLEYLNSTQRYRQKELACELVRDRPISVDDVISRCGEALEGFCAKD